MIRCFSFSCLFFSLVFGSPTAAQTTLASQYLHSSKSWLDLDYVGDGQVGHRLDVHLPAKGKGPFPVVVCIYGSAFFSNNSKAAVVQIGLGQALLQAGYAVVAINHRSSREALFPAQLHDVKAAVRYIRANGLDFHIDPAFVGMTGWSSGGHLSAITGVTSSLYTWEDQEHIFDLEGDLGPYKQVSSTVQAVVDWYGPTDFLIMDSCGSVMNHNDALSPESILLGGPIQTNPLKSRFADPSTYVHAQSPPFLIFHGDQDPLVPHCQSEKLYKRLEQAGVKAELIIVRGGGHGPGVMIKQYFQRMIAFLDTARITQVKNSR